MSYFYKRTYGFREKFETRYSLSKTMLSLCAQISIIFLLLSIIFLFDNGRYVPNTDKYIVQGYHTIIGEKIDDFEYFYIATKNDIQKTKETDITYIPIDKTQTLAKIGDVICPELINTHYVNYNYKLSFLIAHWITGLISFFVLIFCIIYTYRKS